LRILITGKDGQVGWELQRALPALGEVVSTGREDLDLGDADAVQRKVREVKPDLIVNAAAYTAVDKAESEPGLAMRVNGIAPGVLAAEAKRLGALLVHYSTDYVFDGTKSAPYVEDDPASPLNVYGQTKHEGELRVIGSGCRHLILRTSWVYGPRGRNFYLTILSRARQGERLRVVGDQVGAPTSVVSIARGTIACLRQGGEGLFHMTDAGSTSWYGFASAIVAAAGLQAELEEIRSSEYPTPARRPANARLDCSRLRAQSGLSLPDWREDLAQTLP